VEGLKPTQSARPEWLLEALRAGGESNCGILGGGAARLFPPARKSGEMSYAYAAVAGYCVESRTSNGFCRAAWNADAV